MSTIVALGRRAYSRFALGALLAALTLIGGPTATPPAVAAATGFTFTAAGDHGHGDRTDASIDVVASSGSSFYLALGDLSYDTTDGGEQRWCTNFKSRFTDIELIAGNHDTGESSGGDINEYRAYCPFTLGALVGDYAKQYYFDYPQSAPLARFVLIAPGVRGSLNLNYSAGAPGYVFTRDAIDGARAAGIKWIVVGMHKNCISTGDKSCEVGTDLMDLLITKRVDLVLQGHDHNYQRSHALSCARVGTFDASCVADSGTDGLYAKGAGPVVVINGEFGRGLYSVDPADSEAGYFAKIDSTTFGVSRYRVTETSISADYLRSNGGSFADSFTISETATPPPPPPTSTLTFGASDDATIVAGSPSSNYGSASAVSGDNSPVENFLMKFNVAGIDGRRIVSAKLRLTATNGSNSGGNFHRVADNSWSEATVTWSNAPAADAATTASLGSVAAGASYETDLSALITGDGTYSIRVDSPSSDGVDYASSERSTASSRPTLVVTVANTTQPDDEPPTAPAQLTVTAPSHNRVELAWQAATDNSSVSHYTVYRGGAAVTTTAALAFTDATVAPSTVYTYTVTATDAAGNTGPPSNEATVTTPPEPPPPTTLIFAPTADATIKQSFASTNYGTAKTLDIDNSPVERTLMKFSVSGVNGRSIASAKLRLYVRNASNHGGSFRRIPNTSWTETGVTWETAPPADAATVASLGAAAVGTWVEVDISGLITGDGVFAFRIDSSSADGAGYNSKESSSNRPQLVLTVAS